MAITARASGTWQQGLIADTAITIPAGAADGDRMFVLAAWKDYAITAQITSPAGWTKVTEFADGTTPTGGGIGSMKVACWYKNWVSGDTAPTIDFSTVTGLLACAVMVVFQKATGEAWDVPAFVTKALTTWTNTEQIEAASSTVAVPAGALVIGLAGIRDDSTAFTRPTYGIDALSDVVWNGNYVEYPATHALTATGDDMGADAGYRLVTSTTAAPTLRQTATLSAADNGSALWIVQGVNSFTPYRNQMPQLLAQ